MGTKTKKTNSPSTKPETLAETLTETLAETIEGYQGTPFERAVLERLDLIAGLLRALPGQTQVVQQKGLDLSQFKFKVD